MSDQIGGIIEVFAVRSSNVVRTIKKDGRITIILAAGFTWQSLPCSKNGMTVNVVPRDSEPGILYDVSGTIQIPNSKMTDSISTFCHHLVQYGGMLKYTIGSRKQYLVGSEQYPLKFRFEEFHPNSAIGFVGYKLFFSGKQTNQQLQVEE